MRSRYSEATKGKHRYRHADGLAIEGVGLLVYLRAGGSVLGSARAGPQNLLHAWKWDTFNYLDVFKIFNFVLLAVTVSR